MKGGELDNGYRQQRRFREEGDQRPRGDFRQGGGDFRQGGGDFRQGGGDFRQGGGAPYYKDQNKPTPSGFVKPPYQREVFYKPYEGGAPPRNNYGEGQRDQRGPVQRREVGDDARESFQNRPPYQQRDF
jgi:hypothetical protein